LIIFKKFKKNIIQAIMEVPVPHAKVKAVSKKIKKQRLEATIEKTAATETPGTTPAAVPRRSVRNAQSAFSTAVKNRLIAAHKALQQEFKSLKEDSYISSDMDFFIKLMTHGKVVKFSALDLETRKAFLLFNRVINEKKKRQSKNTTTDSSANAEEEEDEEEEDKEDYVA
jgi:hypothetical protein